MRAANTAAPEVSVADNCSAAGKQCHYLNEKCMVPEQEPEPHSGRAIGLRIISVLVRTQRLLLAASAKHQYAARKQRERGSARRRVHFRCDAASQQRRRRADKYKSYSQ